MLSDEYDEQADHLIAIDLKINKIIGTYRFLRKDQLKPGQIFASEEEFDITPIKHENILEIGRAVVSKEYRTGSTIMLLLKGLMNCAYAHKIKYIFGTVSFLGINPLKYSHAFSYIYYNHLSPEAVRVKAIAGEGVALNRYAKHEIDYSVVKKEMPALVKGYINVGSTFGGEAFVDRSFNSVDLFVLAEVDKISDKYINRFVKN